MPIPTNELWWRHIPLYDDPDADLRPDEVVLSVLNEREQEWPDKDDKVRKLFAIAKSQPITYQTRSAAALALSLQCKDQVNDSRHSLIYAAALMNNPIAICSMLAILRWKSGTRYAPREKADDRRVYDHWLNTIGITDISVEILKKASACIESVHTLKASRGMAPELQSLFAPHSRKIVTEIGDAKSGEGRRLATTYAALLDPLPLKAPVLSLEILGEQLNHEFPWFREITDTFIRKLKLRTSNGSPWLHLPPTLLVGPPGCGKTRFLRRLSELAQCGHQIFSAGGSSDCRMLVGTARGWSSPQPCLPLIAMHTHGTANPIIVVDEIEKAQSTHNGSVHNALLSFLESESSRSFYDECLLAKADLSEVSWFATANSLDGIPDPLLSRLDIYKVNGPRHEDFGVIFDALRSDYAKELGIQVSELPEVDEKVRAHLQSAFTNGKSIRQIKRALASAIEHGEWRPVTH